MAHVLLLEDYPPLRSVMGIGLRRVGHTVEVAATIQQARLSSAPGFEIGVFDLELPDGSGLDLAVELLDRGKLNRVVFFTACRDAELIESAARFGEVVPKNGRLQNLLDAVARAGTELHEARSAVRTANGADEFTSASGRSGTRRRVR